MNYGIRLTIIAVGVENSCHGYFIILKTKGL
jgi:hypothetical protein